MQDHEIVQEAASRYYELSIYTPTPGKEDALLERFREHEMRLFERHGMTNIGYWLSQEMPARLYYLLAHDSEEAAKSSWAAFGEDAEWQEIYQASMTDGRLITGGEKMGLFPTDFSPLS